MKDADGNAMNAVSAGATLILTAILGLVTSYIFFPGLMSFDSIFLYRQVIGDYPVTNYHPPIMVYAWRLANNLIGPGGLLVFHQLMYWSAVGFIAICVHKNVWVRCLVVVILGLLPPLWIHSATIWNDVGVMSSFLLAVACGLLIRKTGSKWLLFLAFCLLFYGLAVKRTAILAVIPLFILVSDAYFSAARFQQLFRSGNWKKTATLALGLMTCAFIMSFLVSSVGVEKVTKWPTVALWDLTAVSIAQNQVLVPASVPQLKGDTETETLARMENAFVPEVNAPIMDYLELFPPAETHHELFKAWLNLPWKYPSSYFEHRARVFCRLLGLCADDVYFAFEHRIVSNDYGLQLLNKDSGIYSRSIQWLTYSTGTLVYKGWFYLAILVAVMVFALFGLSRKNIFEKRLQVWLGLSGLLYVLPLFLIAPAADFRYILWMVACSAVMVCTSRLHGY